MRNFVFCVIVDCMRMLALFIPGFVFAIWIDSSFLLVFNVIVYVFFAGMVVFDYADALDEHENENDFDNRNALEEVA